MKPIRSLVQTAFCLSIMSSLAAAWPTFVEEWHLVVRQDEGDAEEPQVTPPPSDDENADGEEDNGGGANTGNLNTASPVDPDATDAEETGEATGGGGGPGGNSTRTRETFDPTDPVGAASFVTPDVYLGEPLYKAGDFVTWVWNYTNVLAEPTAVDVILSCSRMSATWTLTANMSFEDPASYTWDSSVQESDPAQGLLTDEYTLIVKDSDADITSTPEAGYFTRTDLRINIYIPRDPTPLEDWNCATCNGGPPELDHRALGFAATMCLITVASFTWFVTGLNL